MKCKTHTLEPENNTKFLRFNSCDLDLRPTLLNMVHDTQSYLCWCTFLCTSLVKIHSIMQKTKTGHEQQCRKFKIQSQYCSIYNLKFLFSSLSRFLFTCLLLELFLVLYVFYQCFWSLSLMLYSTAITFPSLHN